MSDNVRDIVSSFLRVQIPPKGWNNAIAEEDRLGRIGDKQVKGLLIIALKKIEQLEEKIKTLEKQQNSQPQTIQTSASQEKADLGPNLPPAGTNNAPQQP